MKYVSKADNGSKILQAGWKAKSKYQLQKRNKLKLIEFGLVYVKSLIVGDKTKLLKIGQEGVFL